MTSSKIHHSPLTSPATCAICGQRPAKVVLSDSNLPCCKTKAFRCELADIPNLKCYGCGQPATFINLYGPVCSKTCPILSRQKQARFEATMMERYGVTAALHSPELAAKIRQTTKERFGFEHASQAPGIFDQARERCREEHGVDHWTQRPEVKEAKKGTMLELYGVEHAPQSPVIMETRRQNNRIKYGVSHPQQVASITQKRYATWVKNQGGLSFGSLEWSKEWREKFLKEFGVDHPSKLPETAMKWRSTLLKNLGVDIPMRSLQVRLRQQATMLKRYGVSNASYSPEMLQKARETTQERFGVPYALQNEEVKERYRANSRAKYGTDYPIQSPKVYQSLLSKQYRTFTYTLPSGRSVAYRGYELPAIQARLAEHGEADLIFDGELSIPYIHNGQAHTYYPDIAVNSVRLLIEVKSTYTFHKALETTLLPKFQAATLEGWTPICEIWSGKGVLIARLTLQDIQNLITELTS